jgi:hypothetical protein
VLNGAVPTCVAIFAGGGAAISLRLLSRSLVDVLLFLPSVAGIGMLVLVEEGAKLGEVLAVRRYSMPGALPDSRAAISTAVGFAFVELGLYYSLFLEYFGPGPLAFSMIGARLLITWLVHALSLYLVLGGTRERASIFYRGAHFVSGLGIHFSYNVILVFSATFR